MAASLMGILPTLLVFFAQRYFVQGIVVTGVRARRIFNMLWFGMIRGIERLKGGEPLGRRGIPKPFAKRLRGRRFPVNLAGSFNIMLLRLLVHNTFNQQQRSVEGAMES